MLETKFFLDNFIYILLLCSEIHCPITGGSGPDLTFLLAHIGSALLTATNRPEEMSPCQLLPAM